MSLFVTLTKDGTYMPTTAGFTALVVVMIAAILIGNVIFNRGKGLNAKQVAFSAVAIALALVTSNIKLVHMPYGGSVTLFSMLFVVLIGYWFGLANGLAAAIAYGLLQLVFDPYIISFPQMMCDYVFAFGALGLSGLFSKSKYGLIKGYIIGVLGRYFFSFLSGWIFFGQYAGDYGFSKGYTYSAIYNGMYLGLEALITLIILFVPQVRKGFDSVKKMAVGEA
ncbi:MAG: energy-coupled thiamine transporter ThiT [Lachnospiraceae bacterium]|nr:energy-coupled thiamine transporter ThiT [Lachnospiraceae bacterium]